VQRAHLPAGLGERLQQGVHLVDLHPHRLDRLVARRRRPHGHALGRRLEARQPARDRVEVAEELGDLRGRDRDARASVGREHLLDRVRVVGDRGLLDDPRGALERVREPEQAPDRLGPGRALLELEHAA
jgi:hypothetical protein